MDGQFNVPQPPRMSKNRCIFLLAIFGIPYAMSKLIKLLKQRTQAEAAADGGVLPGQLAPLDPSSLTFTWTLYPFSASNPNELSLKENEIVAIIGKLDLKTGLEVDPRSEADGDWWKGRTRDGQEGWILKRWIEVLEES
jgi:peroxin-13